MASIVETIAGDRRILLGVESFSRAINIGGNWNRVRILFRVSANDSGGSVSTVGLTAGLSSGATQGYESGNMVEFIGAQLGATYLGAYDVGSWGRGTWGSSGLVYYVTGIRAVYKAGSTVTIGGTNGSTATYVPMTSTGNIGALYCDIIRNSGYFEFYGGGYDNSTYGSISMDQFNLGCEITSTSLWNTFGNATLNYAGNGVFDSLMLRWNKASPTLEISNIRVVRYY